jgi:hypothetical protein
VPGTVYIVRNATGTYVSEAVLFGEVLDFNYGGQILIMSDEL